MLDLATVDLILAGVAGLTVVGVTEVIKRALKASGIAGYVISLAVSAAGTALYLVTNHIFAIVPMIGYTLLVFAVSNGLFKATHSPTISK